MAARLSAILSPAEFELLPRQDLAGTVCVVFDVLRATSSMLEALANGAEKILPVGDIADAVRLKRERPALLLAGERNGLRIEGADAEGLTFDFGNSPREFTRDRVAGQSIVMTTTNGTRALRACRNASRVFIAGLLNLSVMARALERAAANHLLLVCSGTFEETAYEDVLAAGGLVCKLRHHFGHEQMSDSVRLCQQIYQLEERDLQGAVGKSRNGRRLLSRAALAEDVAFCSRLDVLDVVAETRADGWVRRIAGEKAA